MKRVVGLLKFIGAVALIWAALTAMSYSPLLIGLGGFRGYVEEQVVFVGEPRTDDDIVDSLKDACRYIPFHMRWITEYPRTVKVVTRVDGHEFGWIRADCRKQKIIDASVGGELIKEPKSEVS